MTSKKYYSWNPEVEITLTGYELNTIVESFQTAIEAYKVLDDILIRATIQGKAKATYVGENGEELSEEAITALSEKITNDLTQTV